MVRKKMNEQNCNNGRGSVFATRALKRYAVPGAAVETNSLPLRVESFWRFDSKSEPEGRKKKRERSD